MFKGSEYAYYAMYLVGFIIMMLINLKSHERYEIEKKKAVTLTLITYVAGVTGALIMGRIYTAVMATVGETGTRVAIYGALIFTPVFMIAAAIAMKQPWRKVIDMLAPGIFIILTCAKFGCFMDGCCPGIKCDFGVFNPDLQATVFPSQLFETATMLFVVAFCLWYAFKFKGAESGTVYPVTAIFYSITRFCWEFLRYYPSEEARHIIFGLTFWQFCCLLTIAVSVAWIVTSKTGWLANKETEFMEKRRLAEKERARKRKAEKNIVHHKKRK